MNDIFNTVCDTLVKSCFENNLISGDAMVYLFNLLETMSA